MNIFLKQETEFQRRHIGSLSLSETAEMLNTIGVASIDELMGKTIPKNILLTEKLNLPQGISEQAYLSEIKKIASKNKIFKSYIGQGYYGTVTPSVILRNIFENPGWYTQYTPYQAEISQGRLESLLNFQTMVSDLTDLPIANASLLDEATSAAEGMTMLFRQANQRAVTRTKFFVDEHIFQQTKAVLQTRATPLDIELVTGNYRTATLDETYFGAIVQYPDSNGLVKDYRAFIDKAHQAGAFVIMAADLLALALLTPPGELNADVAVGSAQRFGVPMGYGGPHAGFFAAKEEFKRIIPGRIIGVSVDAQNNRALRMALQTREQHIKREKATSNICTAQALLANMAAMYAVYHGAEGIRNIALRIHFIAQKISNELKKSGYENLNKYYFDTLKLSADKDLIQPIAEAHQMNFHYFDDGTIGISIDETTTQNDALNIIDVFAQAKKMKAAAVDFDINNNAEWQIPQALQRTSTYLTHPVFNTYHSETQMMRYIKKLENKDLALNTSMIPLGSCTMKLNAATEMMPVSWQEFSDIHPFAPASQTEGYQIIIDELSNYLCTITGFDVCCLQPNSGAQGEFTGLTTIMNYHKANGNAHRNVALIPISAHGTNPASAVMAGMKIIVVKSDENGQIDITDLKAKAEQYKDTLGALMITYPSTFGVFEESVKEICNIIHQNGGQVYMDGANMNAQVGYTSPAFIGADICHLNLHKTFAIPHGGGGPGVGPVCAKAHLKPFLPVPIGKNGCAVSAAAYGSASILLISYAYIKMMGGEGLRLATAYAVLNANYMKARLAKDFPILYAGKNNMCAHEFIVDLRSFKSSVGIDAEDVAKRLMDYGFHAPTLSFPIHDTIMIEPTESEDKAELDRFCDALINIYREIKSIENGAFDKTDNVLKNAPHTQQVVCANEWHHAYTREQAAFPMSYLKENKFWTSVSRINNTYGDRNLVCTCAPMDNYA